MIPFALCTKIINSVVVVGLYYGFLNTFSIAPSYIFLLRTRIMKGEEGTQKKVSEITGLFVGQLVLFISIYYVPLHLALSRPFTFTILALWYASFYAFWNNYEYFFGLGPICRNEISNGSTQGFFLTTFIFQLFNLFIFPSPALSRLTNIYMFRCNNKILFLTSGFVGWLIGQILLIKWIQVLLIWVRKKNLMKSIQSNKYIVLFLKRVQVLLIWIQQKNLIKSIQSNKYIAPSLKYYISEGKYYLREFTYFVLEFRDNIVSILLCTMVMHYLSLIPLRSIYYTKLQVKEPDQIHEKYIKEKTLLGDKVKPDSFSETDNNKFSETDDYKKKLWLEHFAKTFEKPIVSEFFNYNIRRRPFRYIKNRTFENSVKDETTQCYFYGCELDGKGRIVFTYSPSLAAVEELIRTKLSWFEADKTTVNDNWLFNNKQRAKKLIKELRKRVETFEKGKRKRFDLTVLQKRTRFCNITNRTFENALEKNLEEEQLKVQNSLLKEMMGKKNNKYITEEIKQPIRAKLSWSEACQYRTNFEFGSRKTHTVGFHFEVEGSKKKSGFEIQVQTTKDELLGRRKETINFGLVLTSEIFQKILSWFEFETDKTTGRVDFIFCPTWSRVKKLLWYLWGVRLIRIHIYN